MSDCSIYDITAIMVVYKTPDLVKVAYESFRKFYPTVPLIIVDNSEGDDCTYYVTSLKRRDEFLTIAAPEKNIGHGKGLHVGILMARTKLCYVFDSDTEMYEGGMLEGMLELMDSKTYGIGLLIRTDNRGNLAKEGIAYLTIARALINKDVYLCYSPLIEHGAPLLLAMIEIDGTEIQLKKFPVGQYVNHFERGTRDRFGIPLWEKGDIVKYTRVIKI